ncbi:MAG: AcrB/AcrD/AcrF family protein, partial [Bacteroidetes bacterium]
MEKAIKYFIKYPINADVILVLLSLIGMIALFGLTKSQFPTLESSTIIIEGRMHGTSPEEMERAFAYKVEKEIKSVQGIKKITSVSQESSSIVTVATETKVDINTVLQDIKIAVDKINSFPVDLEEPTIYIAKRNDIAAEFVIYGETNLQNLKYYAEKAENDLLENDGIAEIKLSGFPEQEIIISVREYDLNKYSLTFNDLSNAISNSNIDLTAGNLIIDNMEVTIRAKGKQFTSDALSYIVVKTTVSGGLITLKDIANISLEWSDNPNRNYYNDEKSVSVTVYTTANEDIIDAAEITKQYLADFNDSNTQIKAKIVTDGSVIIGQRIDLLVRNGIMGMLLILIILGLFLNIRLAFWVALSLPVSALGMFILAPYFGVNINVFSLFGLILVIGILVDDGVVIAENIYEKYEKGMSASKAALQGLQEVMSPIIVALTTTMVFFTVFFFIEGQVGGFVAQIGFIVIVTLMVSIIEAFFILPAHIAHSKALKKGNKVNKLQAFMDKSIKRFRDKYFKPFLNFSLNNKLLTFSIPIVFFIVSIAMIIGGQARMTFFPYIDTDNVTISVNMPVGTTEDETKKVLDRIELASKDVNTKLSSEREDANEIILSYIKKIGPKAHQGTLTLNLLDGETRDMASAKISSIIRTETGIIHNAEDVKYGASSLFGDAISISLVGDDLKEIREASQFLVSSLKNNPELKDIISSDQVAENDLSVVLKPKAKSLGFTLKEITQQLRNGYLGLEAQSLQIGQNEVKVYVKYDVEETTSYAKLENIKIRKNGEQYPISELVNFEKASTTLSLNHINGKKRINIKAELADAEGSVSEAIADINKNVIAKIENDYPD